MELLWGLLDIRLIKDVVLNTTKTVKNTTIDVDLEDMLIEVTFVKDAQEESEAQVKQTRIRQTVKNENNTTRAFTPGFYRDNFIINS